MQTWFDIKTAPKDAEQLLLSGEGEVSIGFWSSLDGWISMIWNGQTWSLGFRPTHWMPLPEPPND